MPSIALACLIGALCAFYGNQLPDSVWAAYWPIFLWLALWLKPYRLLLVVVSSYLLFSCQFQQALDDRLVSDLHDQNLTIRGKINSLVTERPGRLSFSFKPLDGNSQQLPSTIRLNWYQDKVVPTPGSTWQLEVKLRPPRSRINPGGFDYQQWLLVSGIGATGYVRQSDENQLFRQPTTWDITHRRHQLLQLLGSACANCTSNDLVLGLAIGFRGDITKLHRDLLRQTGTAHLLAISGLHIGIIAGLFFWAGALLWKSLLWRSGVSKISVSAGAALSGAILFSAMAGFSLPTVRALIFVVTVFVAWLFRERISLLQCISVAVVVILVINPLAIGSASFWLTLSALLTIVATLFQMGRVQSKLKQAVILQLAFSLLLALPSLVILGYFSLLSMPANLVAVPLVSLFVLPLIFSAGLLLLAGVPLIPSALLSLADFSLEWLMKYLNWLSELAPSTANSGSWSWWLVFSLAAVLFAWWLPFPNPVRKLAPIVALLVIQWQPRSLAQGEFSLTVLDSGIGNAIVVSTRHHSLLYDFGPGKKLAYSTYENVIQPFLRGQVHQYPDMMIISHVDHDHSGGFYSVETDAVAPILLSGTPQKVQNRFGLMDAPRRCHDYPGWRWDGVEFEFLAELSTRRVSTNNASCVLKITGYHTAILPGDIERQRERFLADVYGDELRANVLVTPHHGSNTSSSRLFLSKVRPQAAIHTQAEGNRWGFPHPAVVARFDEVGARQFSSGSDGAVQFVSTSSGLSVRTSKQGRQRIWR